MMGRGTGEPRPAKRWRIATQRGWALIVGLGLAVALVGCGDDGDWGGGSGYNSNFNGNYNGGSPTGTFLSPHEEGGVGGYGYDVLDEACEDVLDPAYLARFETPMFRGVAPVAGVAHLVDGRRLWSVSLLDPARPRRLSLVTLPGHPLKIAADAGRRLYVAAGEAGLHVLMARDATAMAASAGTGDASAVAPRRLATVAIPGLALDVAVLDATTVGDATTTGDATAQAPAFRYAVVAAGAGGLAVVDASDLAAPEVVATLALPGFATAVAVEGRLAWVAACRVLLAVDLTDPRAPRILQGYSVPLGHARGIFAGDGQVLVAGGEALFVYDGADPLDLLWTGYYAEPDVPGFYVNDVVARDGIAYLAAGDEAVRAVDLRDLSPASGFPAPKIVPQQTPGLDEPAELPPPEEQPGQDAVVVDVWRGDPIAVGLTGDLLMVLGNFRWLGERTLRLLRLDGTGRLEDLSAYVQPQRVVGVSGVEDVLVIHGGDGLETVRSTQDGSLLSTFTLPAPARRWAASPGGLWFLTADGEALRWSRATGQVTTAGPATLRAFDLAAMGAGEGVYLADSAENQIVRVYPGPGSAVSTIAVPGAAFPGYSYLAVAGDYLYAYEWVTGVLHVVPHNAPGGGPPVALRLGLCAGYDLGDFYSGREESHPRLLVREERLWVLCPHDEAGGSSVIEVDLSTPWLPAVTGKTPLPPACYTDFLVEPEGIVTLAFDNNRYETVLARHADGVVVDTVFTGAGYGLLRAGELVHVADGEGGLRLFALGALGEWQALGVLPVGQEE